MRRPAIHDLAKVSGVSVSTVNRVIGGGGVRHATMRRVRDAAESIGFYGLGSIESRLGAARPKYRFGMLLQQPTRTFYKMLGNALTAAAERVTDCDVDVYIEFMEELTPQNVAARLMALPRPATP
jgi:LacI family transcriptional regulator, galactose operon repressor